MDNSDNPWKEPLDEEYWQALLQEGEYPAETVPPMNEEHVLQRAVGLVPATGPTDVPPAEEIGHEAQSTPGNGDEEQRGWELARRDFEEEATVTVRVVGHNRGGLLVEYSNLQGFVPASQLADWPRPLDAEGRRAELASRVGETLSVKIIELDLEEKRLILSERAASTSLRRPDEVLGELNEGDVRQGRVTNLCSFGAFVDLGGVEGLIHISELSWQRVGHPRDVLRSGDAVNVYVLGIDRERERVALSLKRLQPDPWSLVESRYKVGQLVEGTVTNVVSYGAFVRVAEGLEGLIHISELAEGNFLHPRNVVKEGDEVVVRILNIDGARHRLGLSLRQAWTTPPSAGPTDYHPYRDAPPANPSF